MKELIQKRPRQETLKNKVKAKNEFHKYFSEYISKSQFLPLIDDEQKYFLLRRQILGQPTPRQTQFALSTALADIDNDPADDDEK
ncbi:unnamed protein product [Rotaria magnacalcarata]|uniref:Uncharacterized protein n=1 Tax=Rotaria magnacalcarata TaxID=392030 RepID=A0A816G1N1_9BILA|nr:unnamed protein product [Rotaria magnacalcarata]CAF4195768.1 unnamed protein product [Rotaria magnacalcarata]CAF4250627.1 unnamed protein product [Rotaria magnacalcarata]